MGKRIYCGNLSFQATEEEVRGLFEPHGEVVSVHMVMDRETGRPRGFAFVEMADEKAAATAIQALDGSRHLERNLKVNEAKPREERGGGGGERGTDFTKHVVTLQPELGQGAEIGVGAPDLARVAVDQQPQVGGQAGAPVEGEFGRKDF